MLTVLIPQPAPSLVASRLRDCACRVSPLDATCLADLQGEPPDHVLFFPEAVLRSPEWPRWRVELNRAGRRFLVGLDAADVAATVAAMREGAHDVVAVTDPVERWSDALAGAARAQALWQQLYGGTPLSSRDVLLGRSEALHRLRQTIGKLGPTDVTVLIQGESGVGKECVAEAIHQASRRSTLVSLNCAAIPKDLMESELFGAERGAFTGAVKSRPGFFEQAAGGTLFLDEVGELDPSVQPKLLRVLESRRARRVGGEGSYPVTARIVAATNRNLDTEVTAGRFRLDLFYRLAEITLQVPPLRARPEDIPELAAKFLAGANERFGKNIQALEPALLARFQTHAWPGNVRELKSTIDRLVLLFDGPVLRENWWEPLTTPVLPSPGSPAPPASLATPAPLPPAPSRATESEIRPGALPTRHEKLALAKEWLAAGQSPGDVAARLGINPSTLFRWRQSGKVP